MSIELQHRVNHRDQRARHHLRPAHILGKSPVVTVGRAGGKLMGRIRGTVVLALLIVLGTLLTGGLPAVAEPSGRGPVEGTVKTNSGQDLNIRQRPATTATVTGTLPTGSRVTIQCQSTGSAVDGKFGRSNIWDRIGPAQWVSDAYVLTGSDGFVAAKCDPDEGSPIPAGPTLPLPLSPSCPANADAMLETVRLPSASRGFALVRLTMHYGELPLQFHAEPAESLCRLVSQRGALPVIFDATAAGRTITSVRGAVSVTTATLDFMPSDAGIRSCDFSLMSALSRQLLLDTVIGLPNGTEDCYLNGPGKPGGLSVKWMIPGFAEHIRSENGPQVFKTRDLAYYVDVTSLLGQEVQTIDSRVVNTVENYIHKTLIDHMPAITPVGLLQKVSVKCNILPLRCGISI